MAAVLVLTAARGLAQISAGNLTGTVTDAQGAVLPGVSITLAGTDRTASAVSDEAGRFRFLSLPPGFYSVTAALQGFTTVVRERIEVRVGQNVDIPVELRIAAVTETVTVTGESPIVDARQMGTATNFTADELSGIPNSRDPWALLRTVPGVVMDRVNIAGNETGQQSSFVGRGARTADARGRSMASRSPIWPRSGRRPPTSTTTLSRRSRYRRAAMISASGPAASA
jgi:Carboxypeptidase regulatory-like domain